MKILSLFALLLICAYADNWVVIIAGSNNYYNYRHQANVAHQYKMYLDYGVKPEHIIVFSYDDAPSYSGNPFPGKLYNLPGDDAEDYYQYVKIDYKGKEITKKNLFNALLGKEDGSGHKVLKSTSKDKVFINYYDHGAVDLIALIDERITKDELQNVMNQMSDMKMFKEMVFYLEACDSATMMIDYPDDRGVYVVTSTDAAVSGYACFCPPNDVVHGTHIGACLSEEFGYAYMKDMDENGGKDTFPEQFTYLYNSMSKSKPKKWADMSFQNETLAEFFGVNKKIVKPSQLAEAPSVFWDTRDNKLRYLENQLARNDLSMELRTVAYTEYKEEAQLRDNTDRFFYNLVERTVGSDQWEIVMKIKPMVVKNVKCYYESVKKVDTILPISDYELKYFHIMANICDMTGLSVLPM